MAKRKPGKYDHLLPKLPKLPPEDLEYQQRVEEVKKMLRVCPACHDGDLVEHCHACHGSGRRTLTGKELASLYVESRLNVEEVSYVASAAGLALEAVSQLLIASQEQHESRQVPDSDWGAYGASDRAMKLLNGDSLRVQPEVYPVPSDKTKFREWCYNNGLRSKMELPPKPMTDLAKARLLNGDLEPEGLKIYVRTKIVYTPLKTEVTSTNDATEDAEVF